MSRYLFHSGNYAVVAKILKAQRGTELTPVREHVLDSLTEDFAAYFLDDNPGFDISRFHKAAGYVQGSITK